MNKYFSAALYCGLLLSGGKTIAAGTDLLERLNNEKIIGNDSTNPFIASEATATPPAAATGQSLSQKKRPAEPFPLAVPAKNDKANGINQAKISRLTEALSQANATIANLDKQLSVVESEKSQLEQAVAQEKDRVAEKEQALARLKSQPDGSAQKLALESLIATLPKTAGTDQQKNAELVEQLSQANAQRAALSKALDDLQAQKNALDAQLIALKAGSDKSSNAAKEIDTLKSQLSDLNQQKAAIETRLAEQEKQLNSEKAKSEIALKQLEDAKQAIATQESLLAAQKSSAGSDKAKLAKELTDLQTQKNALDAQLASMKAVSEKNATLTKALADLQAQKNALETQLGALKTASEKSASLSRELAELQTQKKGLETQLAAMKETAEKNAALTKALADLQTQKNALDAQLAALMASSDKNGSVVKEADALKSQLSDLNQQKATIETRLAEQEKQLNSEKAKSEIALKQLEDAKKVIASQESLLAMQKNNTGIEIEQSSAQLALAGKETAELKKQLAQLQAQNTSLEEKHQSQSASLAALTAENDKLKESQATAGKEVADATRVKIDKTASKDTLTSYAIGTWYGDMAGQEKTKLNGLKRKLDLHAFTQGFNDKVNNKLQLAPAALSKELTALEQLQKNQFDALLLQNDKQSKAIMSKAANEKGAKRLPDGAVYRVLKQGEAPMINSQNEIITEIDEVLGTGKVMSSKEVRASRVKDLPPLFQTVVKKLGLGGEVKMHIPAKQAYGEAGVPGFVPPGTVSIITIKIIGIK